MKIRCQQFGQKKSTFSNTFIKLFIIAMLNFFTFIKYDNINIINY